MGTSEKRVFSGIIWKFLERIGVLGVQFVLQIVLARILDPEHYGVLSIMIIFTTLATVFIQSGFNTAIIQNKDVQEEDYSSVLWVSLLIAIVLYGLIFISAPLIGRFYEMPVIVKPLRVLALMLFPGTLNSVQLAKVNREMDFKKVFYGNIGAVLASGIIGIVIAVLGGGIWALVAQTLSNVVVATIVMCFTVKLHISLRINFRRVKVLFAYGWKLLVSSLIDTLYQDLRSLIIGKKYDSGTLGFYNRGKQFPQFIINAINGTVQSVMLPAMSAEQDDKMRVKTLMRNSITLSAYIIFPLMFGLGAVANPLVGLLLTDKWLPCVPYLQIYCFSFAFYPVHSCNLQAINAMGRSDIFLKLEIIKKAIGIASLVIAVFCFQTPIAIAMTGVFTTVTSCFINAYPNKKLIGYSYFEQMKDLLPSLCLSCTMAAIVLFVGSWPMGNMVKLILQILIGIMMYFMGSVVFRFKPFMMMKNTLLAKIKKG